MVKTAYEKLAKKTLSAQVFTTPNQSLYFAVLRQCRQVIKNMTPLEGNKDTVNKRIAPRFLLCNTRSLLLPGFVALSDARRR